jgi:hypothetical protein
VEEGFMLSAFDITILVVVLLGLCAWVIANKKAEASLKKTLENAKDTALYQSQFKCALFKPCTKSCRKALEYSTKPILMADVPKLPLHGCNEAVCECSFTQLEDRRSGKDRRDNESASKRLANANKRMLKDRRRDSIREFLLPKYRHQY